MLTAAQVAAMLGISTRAVYDLPPERLPRYGFGRAVRYEPADVEAFKASLPTPPGPPLHTARVLREYERLRLRAAAVGADDLPELSPALKAIAEKRGRRLRMAQWANAKAIAAIYDEAKRLTEATGIRHEVDHVVPLLGKYVSGLHVEANLSIVTRAENAAKSNRYEP